ncbi:MAG: ABC transporter permease [Bacteriovoracaceae bacterium]
MRRLKELILSFHQIFLYDRSSILFSVAIVIGMGFSISVILSTIGIMDGFVKSLKSSLNKSNGDVIVYSKEGFLDQKDKLYTVLSEIEGIDYTSFIQTEGFLVHEGSSQGILVKGVDSEKFSFISGLSVDPKEKEVYLGKELSKKLELEPDEGVVIAIADGNRELSGLPALHEFNYKKNVTHRIFEKDSRFAYVRLEQLQELMDLTDLTNTVAIKVTDHLESEEYENRIREVNYLLKDRLGPTYSIRSYWEEYAPLIQAVEVEKVMISMILQLIVLVSMFNVLAFIIFMNEKRIREIFLLQALGLSRMELIKYMSLFTLSLLAGGCALSLVFVEIFDYLLQNLSVFSIPGDVYIIGGLKLSLKLKDYLTVFFIAFVWLVVINLFGIIRYKKKSILDGLRREFA